MIERRPYFFEPGSAARRSATSRWTRKTTRGVRAANSRSKSGVATEYGRLPITASAGGSVTVRASPVTTRIRSPKVVVRKRASRRSRSITVSGPIPRRRRAAVRTPSPPPISTTGRPGGSSTSAASASATNGSERNDCPQAREGRTPRRSRVSRTAFGRSGTPDAAGESPRSGRDEEPVLVVGTAQLLLDPRHDQSLGALQVQPLLDVLEALERRAAPLVDDLLHRLLP